MDDYREANFVEADFTRSQFRGVDFSGVRISDALLHDVELSGQVDGLLVNGVDVTEYVEGVLDERHPERALLRPTDPAGMRTAWELIEGLAATTLERARSVAPARLDESVDGEWTFLETLRHLVFATDRWIIGPVFGDEQPFHPLGMPNPPRHEVPPGIFDLDASPTLDEVLTARRDRMDRVADFLADIEESELDVCVQSPNGGTTAIRNCLLVVLREEWWHHQYANRDLDILQSG